MPPGGGCSGVSVRRARDRRQVAGSSHLAGVLGADAAAHRGDGPTGLVAGVGKLLLVRRLEYLSHATQHCYHQPIIFIIY